MYANSPQNTIENFYFCNINMWRHENDTFLGISGIQWNIVGLY